MERISTNGEIYVKASAIARELGYTADYVGQLCRGGKVDAQLIGRSWFVNEASIREHKRDRYRSTAAKSRQEIQKVVQQGSAHNLANSASTAQFSYEEDTNDLFPVIDESHKQVRQDESVAVEGLRETADVETAPEPVSEPVIEEIEESKVVEAEEYSVPLRRIEPVVARRQRRPTPQHGVRVASAAPHTEAITPIRRKKSSFITVLATFLLFVGILSATFIVSTGAEQRVVASSSRTLKNSYGFNTAAVHTAAEYFSSFVVNQPR